MTDTFAYLQGFLPLKLISRLTGWLAALQRPRWLIQRGLHWYVSSYQVDLSEAKRKTIADYQSFNDLFTRELAATARPIDAATHRAIFPADGHVSACGPTSPHLILTAKNHPYQLATLLGDEQQAHTFAQGFFCLQYLSPRDYHRVHAPLAGQLLTLDTIAGGVYSVNPASCRQYPDIFTRNARIIYHFDTAFGKMVVIMIGALNVSSMITAWHGKVATAKPFHRIAHHDNPIHVAKGDYIGHFALGSSVITLFERLPDQMLCQCDRFHPMGEAMISF